ncbi:Zn-dependent hydrolase [Caballeronia sp. SEWSISQ10-4 2]|uniref:Zn-dependent hydrolase n=1 Tax=Caballeronia sp. SEWSISQ10-4 2 TaxID=2937438 RepID=UPI00264E5E95|nr:Zn-dependent hydrolase [Caballeronia sp. SEWSISQ10-4 2]MDN7179468.1 Zn-dependent hydrolase [Caballeronia sp. SEWSISQ10-4 2]
MTTTSSLLPLDLDRLWARVEKLAGFVRTDVPWTRRAFSGEFLRARDWLQSEFIAAGLTVELDAGGNLIGRHAGSEPALAPLVSGSHCDTVVAGGRFDGIIGVLAALEVAHALKDAKISLRHSLEVIDFLSEEPSDYGVSCVGSRALCGKLGSDMLCARNHEGETLREAMLRIGARPDDLGTALRGSDSVAAFVELHIEQGPVLESRNLPIGVVTNIVGIRRVAISVIGQPDHAGTTPMDLRRDALVGAARLIETTHRMASTLSGRLNYVVATVGRIAVEPNVPNAVPGRVDMVLEVRSDTNEVLQNFPENLMRETQAHLHALRLDATFVDLTSGNPTDCSDVVIECVEQAADHLGYASVRMPSGAGHDAVYMKNVGPMGMIFMPCLDGRSHCPEEWLDPNQLLDGTRVLAETLLLLDRVLGAK